MMGSRITMPNNKEAKPSAMLPTMIAAHRIIAPRLKPTARALLIIAVTMSVSRSMSIGTATAESAYTSTASAPNHHVGHHEVGGRRREQYLAEEVGEVRRITLVEHREQNRRHPLPADQHDRQHQAEVEELALVTGDPAQRLEQRARPTLGAATRDLVEACGSERPDKQKARYCGGEEIGLVGREGEDQSSRAGRT